MKTIGALLRYSFGDMHPLWLSLVFGLPMTIGLFLLFLRCFCPDLYVLVNRFCAAHVRRHEAKTRLHELLVLEKEIALGVEKPAELRDETAKKGFSVSADCAEKVRPPVQGVLPEAEVKSAQQIISTPAKKAIAGGSEKIKSVIPITAIPSQASPVLGQKPKKKTLQKHEDNPPDTPKK